MSKKGSKNNHWRIYFLEFRRHFFDTSILEKWEQKHRCFIASKQHVLTLNLLCIMRRIGNVKTTEEFITASKSTQKYIYNVYQNLKNEMFKKYESFDKQLNQIT